MSLAAPFSPPEPDHTLGRAQIRYGAPFDYCPPRSGELPLVFASPHSGQHYPDAMREALCVPLIDLQRTEDAFVDELIAPGREVGSGVLTARYARGFVDLNRDALEQIGHSYPCGNSLGALPLCIRLIQSNHIPPI